jgi:hypothetical protein
MISSFHAKRLDPLRFLERAKRAAKTAEMSVASGKQGVQVAKTAAIRIVGFTTIPAAL